MLKIYVAGRYNGPDVMAVADNISKGRDWSIKIMDLGCAVFCPWNDFELAVKNPSLKVEAFKKGSIEFMLACDAVFLLPGWTESPGAIEEAQIALSAGIPIFENWGDFKEWVALKQAIRGEAAPAQQPDFMVSSMNLRSAIFGKANDEAQVGLHQYLAGDTVVNFLGNFVPISAARSVHAHLRSALNFASRNPFCELDAIEC